LLNDVRFAERIAAVEVDLLALEQTTLRLMAAAQAGTSMGVEPSILKIRGTEIAQQLPCCWSRCWGQARRDRWRPARSLGAPVPQLAQAVDLRRFQRSAAQHHRQVCPWAVNLAMSTHPTSSEHQALHDSATRFLAGLADFARQRQRQQTGDWRLDRALWHQFGHLGWLGVMMPEAYGGLGLPAGDALTIMQAMGAHRARALRRQSGRGPVAAGSGQHRAAGALVPRVCTGTALLLPAHAEPGAGYALACVQTHAQSVGDGFRLEGRKSARPGGRTPMAGWFRRAAPAPWAMP
jgi:alkylation response protein AidB-like acyl-CoA dehydrogenase